MFAVVFLCVFLYATGSSAFTVTTTTPVLRIPENEGADLKCSHSGDFGSDARIEWKFKNLEGTQSYVFFSGKPTTQYMGRIVKYDGGLRINKVTRKDTGDYDCEVSGNDQFKEATIRMVVLVAPTRPQSRVPTSATTGSKVVLTCFDPVGSPPPIYRWFKDNAPLPEDPSKFPNYKNITYKINPQKGTLEFPSVKKIDSGSYFCEASNGVGTAQRGSTTKMNVRDVNTGGIVAGVIVALLAIALLIFGLWYAKRKGYLPKMSDSKQKSAMYTIPVSNEDDGDGEFKQKSSFVV